MASALLAVVLLPALGALINGLRAASNPLEPKSRAITSVIAYGSTGLSALVATLGVVIPYMQHGTESPLVFTYYTWIPSGMGRWWALQASQPSARLDRS